MIRTSVFSALVAAFSLAAVLVVPALAAPAALPGPAEGVFIGCGVDRFALRTTDPIGGGDHHYTGTIVANGRITDVRLVRAERGDYAVVDGDGVLHYSFHTHGFVDGVDWRAVGWTRMTFNLSRDGALMSTDDISLCALGHHPDSNPFTLNR